MSEGTDTAPASRPLPGWAVVAIVAVLIGALAFAIGRFTAFGATTVPSTPSTTSADAGFARDMQEHHAQAVTMAMEIYRKTEDPELRVLAYDIATGQAAQRGEMFDWLVQWGLPQARSGPAMAWMTDSGAGHDHGGTAPATDAEAHAAMGMASDAELAALAQATGPEADCLFLSLMIRHHEGAVPMAQAAVDLAEDARVVSFAQAVVAGQSAEIDRMQSMQVRLACG